MVLLALSGCSLGKRAAAPPLPSEPPPPSGSAAPASPTPSASAQAFIHFTVDGAGPYLLGATLGELQSAGQLDDVRSGGETCAPNTTARGKGVWQDIRMSFRPDGKLYLATNRSVKIPTPSGAWLGTTLAGLQSIYPAIGEVLTLGTAKAFLVTTGSGRGILFDLDSTLKVITMAAADAAYLKSSYLGGTDFC